MSPNAVIAVAVAVFLLCVLAAGPRKFVERAALIVGYAALAVAILTAVTTWWLIPAANRQVAAWQHQVTDAVTHPSLSLPSVPWSRS